MLSTAACAREAGLDRKVARMALEELAAIGVVWNDHEADDSDDHQGVVRWSLKGDDGALIAKVFGEFAERQGWDEILVYTPTSPPQRGEESGIPGEQPYFRPTPGGPSDQAQQQPFDYCQTCGQRLTMHPDSQRHGICERCHLAEGRAS